MWIHLNWSTYLGLLMRALIDADRLAYAFGGFTDEDGLPLGWPLVAERIDSNIRSILEHTGADEGVLYLTSDDGSNFRIKESTITKYKGQRSNSKPFWYTQIRSYLVDRYEAVVCYGLEADDALGIAQYSHYKEEYLKPSALADYNVLWWNTTVICSVDKDLDLIPGKHFNELHPERGIYELSEIDCLRNFYSQCLTGDSTDSIPGLYGVGRSSSLLKQLSTMAEERSMYLHVREQYQKRFGNYWKMFLWENSRLLWILREENQDIRVHLELLESEAA